MSARHCAVFLYKGRCLFVVLVVFVVKLKYGILVFEPPPLLTFFSFACFPFVARFGDMRLQSLETGI